MDLEWIIDLSRNLVCVLISAQTELLSLLDWVLEGKTFIYSTADNNYSFSFTVSLWNVSFLMALWWFLTPYLYRWVVLDLQTKEVVSDLTDGNEQLSVMRYSPGQRSTKSLYKKKSSLMLIFVSSLFVEHRACVLMWLLLLHAYCSAALISLFAISNCYFTAHPNIDGSFLAVGSHDNFIYIYNVTEGGRRYTRFGKCTVSKACWEKFGSSILNDVKLFYGGLLFIVVYGSVFVLKCLISHANTQLFPKCNFRGTPVSLLTSTGPKMENTSCLTPAIMKFYTVRIVLVCYRDIFMKTMSNII